jgi:hypothetical protein
MNARTSAGRLVAGLAVTLLLAGCGPAGGGSTTAPANPEAAVVAPTPAPTPTTAPSAIATPTATAPSPLPTAIVYDASTAVNIHVEKVECVTGEAGTTDYVNGVRQMRGWTRHCRYDAADPRFSGWSDIVVNSDCYMADHSQCVRWGTERIPGPDGDWVGTYRGGGFGGEVGGARFNFAVLEGTGAYEGWTYVSYMNMAALGGEEWVIDGLVYDGPPPPVPPPPSPASE